MFCEKCGSGLFKGAKFCENCGAMVELDIQSNKGSSAHTKWILGGILSGIVIAAVASAAVFATGIIGGGKETTLTSVNGGVQSDPAGSDAVIATTTEQPTSAPVETIGSTPEPTVVPIESEEANQPEEPVDEDESEIEDEKNSEYIFPNSDSEYLTKSDVKNLSAKKINLAKNELYARHGRKFEREDLQEYFEGCSWYIPIYTAKEWDKYGDSYFFNDYEIKNRNLLKKWEDKKK